MKIVFQEYRQRVCFLKNNRLIVDGKKYKSRLYRLNFNPVCVAEANITISVTPGHWHENQW